MMYHDQLNKVTMRLSSIAHNEGLLVPFASFAGFAGLFIGADRWTESNSNFLLSLDHQKYLYMASHGPLDFHIAPFCWRILTPLIVSLLPIDSATGFAVLNFAALWLTAIVLYFTLKIMGFSARLAFVGLAFFMTLGWATLFNLEDFWLSDPLGMLFATAAIWSIYARKDMLFAVLLAIGVLAKESVIFVAPLWYTINARRPFEPKLLRRQLTLIIPAVVMLILLRLAISPMNGDSHYLSTLPQHVYDGPASPYSVGLLLRTIGLLRIQQISVKDLYEYTFGTFGLILSGFALAALLTRENRMHLSRYLPFILLTYASLLLATDTSRLLVAAFPVVIPMALYGMKRVGGGRVQEWAWIALPLILYILFVFSSWSHEGLYLVSPKLELSVGVLYGAAIFLSRAKIAGQSR